MKNSKTTLIYVLSIMGLLCCCFGGLGIFLSGTALFMANKKITDAELNPKDYEGDINALKTAKTIALVVTIINGLYLAFNIYDLATGGLEQRIKMINDMMETYKLGIEGAS